jgi:hypothetical protein
MTPLKFKLGDTVRVVKDGTSINKLGDVGVITELDPTSPHRYRVNVEDRKKVGNWQKEEEIKLVFKENTKVKIPKTKSCQSSYEQFLPTLRNYDKPYLIIKDMFDSGVIHLEKDSPFPTIEYCAFLETDLEHYEENKTETEDKTTKTMKLEDVALTGFTRTQLAVIKHIIDLKGGNSAAVGDNYFGNYTHIVYSSGEHICGMTCYPNVKTDVSFGQFVELLEAHKAPKPPVVFKKGDIHPDYTVVVNEKGVKVGCQYVSFENFDKLVLAAIEFRKD